MPSVPNLDVALRQAEQWCRQGRLRDADALYRQLRVLRALSAADLQRLGRLAAQLGHLEESRLLFDQAWAIAGPNPDLLADLGNLHRLMGDSQQAQHRYEAALSLDPSHIQARYNLAQLWLAAGQVAGAIAQLEQLLRQTPTALPVKVCLAAAREQTGNAEGAIALYREVLAIQPQHLEVLNNLGTLLLERGESVEALSLLRQAVQRAPRQPMIQNSFGLALEAGGHYAEAQTAFELAASFDPRYPDPLVNLGQMLKTRGDRPGAQRAYEAALQRQPNYPPACYALGELNLQLGNWREGFRAYEARLQISPSMSRSNLAGDIPPWDGSTDLNGKTLLVTNLQGQGDAIMMVRCLPQLAERGITVTLRVVPSLQRLFDTAAGVSQVLTTDEALPPCDAAVDLMSLPHLLGLDVATIPATMPYLQAATSPALPTRDRSGLQVGLAWASSQQQRWALRQSSERRSCPVALLLDALKGLPLHCYSLQIGPGSPDELPPEAGITDLSPLITDFADTAALMQQLDLVISVDTAVAHLAGALGKPTWTLLPFDADWRWLLDRSDTPWYPSMRLFRQPSPGDWRSVMAELRQALFSR
jgi:tetratricopeptide (TPR) repeat protein